MIVFETIQDFMQYTDTTMTIRLTALQPSLKRAMKTLKRVLGASVVEAITTIGTMPADLSPDEKAEILNAYKSTLAPIAMALFIPRKEATITEAGVKREENETTKTAFKYQITGMIESYMDDGLDALDNLIDLIESKSDKFPVWQNSGNRQDYKKLLIRSGSELQQLFNVSRPQVVYSMIRHTIDTVQQLIIFKAVPSELFNKTNPTESESKAIQFAIKATAYLSIWQACAEKLLRFDHNGVTAILSTSTNTEDIERRKTPERDSVTLFSNQTKETGYLLLKEAIDLLTIPEQANEQNTYTKTNIKGAFSL